MMHLVKFFCLGKKVMSENVEADILLKITFCGYFFKCWSTKMPIATPNCVECLHET